MTDFEPPTANSVADLLDEFAALAVNVGGWIVRRLRDTGFADDAVCFRLFICDCGKALLILNRRAESFEPSLELVCALRTIAPLGHMIFIDGDTCVCGGKTPEAPQSRLNLEFDTAGHIREIERRQFSS